MEIILSKQCAALTGSLGKGFGYFIVRRWSRTDVKFRYYSQRSKWDVPANGHLRFIFACAELAQLKTHITEILVPRSEFEEALREAGKTLSGARDIRHELSAADVLTLKERFDL